jgi:pimeloyl-ACP methyl ester carboxylesterase
MKLYFHESGSCEPVILLHGLLGSHHNWLTQAEKLSSLFRVFALDHRNHGQSPHAAEFNYDAMARDVLAFMREQDIGKARIVGHSMGGKVAMRLAQLHPEVVDRIVVADMSVHSYPPRYTAMLDAMLALDLNQFQQRNEVDIALEPVVASKTMRQFLIKNLGRDAAGTFFWKPNLPAIRSNYDRIRSALPEAQPVDCPALFIRGAKSDYVRETDLELIRQSFPKAELKTIEDAGHWVHAEAPEKFNELLLDFLTRRTPSQSGSHFQ